MVNYDLTLKVPMWDSPTSLLWTTTLTAKREIVLCIFSSLYYAVVTDESNHSDYSTLQAGRPYQ